MDKNHHLLYKKFYRKLVDIFQKIKRLLDQIQSY